MKEIRKLIAVKVGNFDTNYTLVRTAAGEIFVETFDSPNRPFQTGDRGPTIYPDEFDQHIIDGQSLRQTVAAAIRQIDSQET